jgi:hypothetical protein
MRIASGWHRRGARALALAAVGVGLALAAAGPAPAGATEAGPPVAPPAPVRHGGGGFALVLLGYRQALEQLTLDLRGRAAELAGGAEIAPAELAAPSTGSGPARIRSRWSESDDERSGLQVLKIHQGPVPIISRQSST